MNNYKKLEVGRTYKNYREVCAILGESVKTSNSKKSQIKDWEANFSFTKQGHSITVTEIFEEAKQKLDGRTIAHNATSYVDYIEVLLAQFLLREEGQLIYSKNQLAKLLQMVNSNYSNYNYRRLELASILEVDVKEINDVYNITSDILKNNIELALKRMQKNKVVDVNEITMITKVEIVSNSKVSATEIKNKYGDYSRKFGVKHDSANVVFDIRPATPQERSVILSVQKMALEVFECANEREINNKGLRFVYIKYLNDFLLENYGINNFYKAYDIVMIKSEMEKISEKLDLEIMYEMANKLNDEFMTKAKGRVKSSREKTINEMKEVFIHKNEHRAKVEYIPNTDKIIDKITINKADLS